ncbi:hypothetical protein R1sor_027298 [Riccia sorocarpa]|uniref:DUF4219 domain-containing protein n=1 Tax=Riccia sorocarpa TaxID=122646 RepID=A0ABD3GH40_9MARC
MANSFSSGFSEKEKLRGDENYCTWKWRLQGILDERDLWEYVELPPSADLVAYLQQKTAAVKQQSSNPAATASAQSTVASGSTSTTTTSAAPNPVLIEAERKSRRKAMNVIRASLADEVITHVIHMDDPHTCWKALQDMYNTKTNARPSDDVVVLQILSALPESFDSIVNVISGETSLPSLTQLTGRLQQEDDRKKARDGGEDVEALLVRLRRVIRDRRTNSGSEGLSGIEEPIRDLKCALAITATDTVSRVTSCVTATSI